MTFKKSSPQQRIRDSQAGQSTIEFALTLILLMAFVFLYMQISLIFGYGNYAHYATFMSARAYLAAGSDVSDQETRARDVIVKMLKKSAGESGTDRYPSIAKGFGAGEPTGFQVKPPDTYSDSNQLLSWQQGVRYTFRSKLFLMPLAGKLSGEKDPGVNFLTLTSESWLGKEPSAEECAGELQKLSGGAAGGTGKRVMYDNGC